MLMVTELWTMLWVGLVARMEGINAYVNLVEDLRLCDNFGHLYADETIILKWNLRLPQ